MRCAVTIALVVLFAMPLCAQEVEIKKPKPLPPVARELEREVIPPGLYDVTRPGDADIYPRGGQVGIEPAFVRPLSSKVETPNWTGRAGVAGWVSPNTPVGPQSSGWKEVSGWFALGITFTWDGPPPARRPAPVP
jgi:hypothetical protein